MHKVRALAASFVRASEKTRKALEELSSGRADGNGAKGDLVKLASRLIVEEALEGEVKDHLRRGNVTGAARALEPQVP